MHRSIALACLIAVLPHSAIALQPKVPTPEQQIAAVLLPLPEVLSAGAGVVGYNSDL
jgi:hypothetical protein